MKLDRHEKLPRRLVAAIILLCLCAWVNCFAAPDELPMLETDSSQSNEPLSTEIAMGIIPGVQKPQDNTPSFMFLAANASAGSPKYSDIVKVALNSGPNPIAVLYPEIGEPYRSVFAKILEGIEDKAKTRVLTYAVGPNFNVPTLLAELRRYDIRIVIALGRHGIRVATQLDPGISVVVSGVLSIPEAEIRDLSVFALAPDPGLLFDQLKSLQPSTRRVFVVYDPRQNGWLIRLAYEAAKARNIELVAQEAQDLKNAIRFYQDIFAAADAKHDALWLLQDSLTVDESSVLPLVLQEAWDRPLVVFSSNVSHVKRGALFSLYPDNLELGHTLGIAALGYSSTSGQAGHGIKPLKEVLTAVNLRTASHLGLNLSYKQQRSFNLIFPEP